MAGALRLLRLPGSMDAVGKAQLNLGMAEWTAQNFTNLFNAAIDISFSGGATPAALDDDQYPVRNFTGSINAPLGWVDKTLSTTGPWTFKWDAGRAAFKINFLKAGTTSNPVNCADITNGSGTGNLTVIGDGANAGSVTINWNNTDELGIQFDGSYAGNYANNTTGAMALVRTSDLARYDAGEFWTLDYINLIKALKPEALRAMGWNLPRGAATDSNEAIWATRRKTTSFSFIDLTAYPTSVRSGGAAGFGTITNSNGAYTAAAADITSLSGWVHGETITGSNSLGSTPIVPTNAVAATGTFVGKVKLTVADTTGLAVGNPVKILFVNGTTEANGRHAILALDDATHFTIDVTFANAWASSPGAVIGYQTLTITGKSGGKKLIYSNLGTTIGTGFSSEQLAILAGSAVYTYDVDLDAVIYTSGGIALPPPIEAQCQLCNRVNAHFWYNSPPMATDDFITNIANTAYANLNSHLKFKFEIGNEWWNSHGGGFTAFLFATSKAQVLGLSTNLDYQSLRIRQIFGDVLPATSWSAAMSRLERMYCFQGGTGIGDTGITAYMSGSTLGAFGYDVSPNRPIDFTNAIDFAPYISGTALSGQAVDLGSTVTAADAVILQNIATLYNSGNVSGAVAAIDDAVRQGRTLIQTVTASGTTFTTPIDHGFTPYVHNVSDGNLLRFAVSGGTIYSGIDPKQQYIVIAATSTTFRIRRFLNGDVDATDVNAGTAGTGTMSVGSSSNGASIFDVQAQFEKWEAVAASFDSSRAAAGLPNVKLGWYEGATELTAPTAAQCFAIGVTLPGDATGASAAAAIDAARMAWKFDPMAALTFAQYHKAFVGTDATLRTFGQMAHAEAPAQLVLMGGGNYALMGNLSVTAPELYQLYNGFAAFSAS